MVPVVDVRAKVAAITAENRISGKETRKFLRHRRKLLRRIWAGIKAFSLSKFAAPVGYAALGVEFDKVILGFRASTAIYWYAVAPKILGGTSSSLVYLTASNEATRGCEALVAYDEPRSGLASFRVFDWADEVAGKPPWGVVLPHAEWTDYSVNVKLNDKDHAALYIANKTSHDMQKAIWCNEVFLFNGRTKTFDLLWHNAYVWNPAPNDFFDWGPIIEPIETPYDFGTTNEAGYAEAKLVIDGATINLLPANTTFKDRKLNFEMAYGVANHTLLAT